jgi:DNA-binding response OmpR family regulator
MTTASGPDPSPQPSTVGAPPSVTSRVLLVEDEPALAELARLYLERDGHRVDVVGDSEAALAAVARRDHDLVLLDIGLPGSVDGIEVCRRSSARTLAASSRGE